MTFTKLAITVALAISAAPCAFAATTYTNTSHSAPAYTGSFSEQLGAVTIGTPASTAEPIVFGQVGATPTKPTGNDQRERYAMLLAGLGALGFVARRRSDKNTT